MRTTITLLIIPLMVGCAAFQKGASDVDAAAASDQITTGASAIAPFFGPFAPFLPLVAGIAVHVGKLMRKK